MKYNKMNKFKTKEQRATESFKNRIDTIIKNAEVITFADICQQIMTDYQLQNDEMKVSTTKNVGKGNKKSIYEHYRKLLYICIKEIFIQYVKVKYEFLTKPERSKSSTGEFDFYKKIDLKVKSVESISNKNLLAWYVMAHFLNAKQINHLIGDIKSYIQYVQDIKRRQVKLLSESKEGIDKRAPSTRVRVKLLSESKEGIDDKCENYKIIVRLLEAAQIVTGGISETVDDYFDEESYNDYLKHFFDNELSDEIFKGIFFDEKNPILNRNVVFAKLFGDIRVTGNIRKMTSEDVERYKDLKAKLEKVFERGYCENKNELELQLEYQRLKNRIELVNVKIYMEIVNDLINQIISWSYLRERDMMYFQLGMHYIKLYWCDNLIEENDIRRKMLIKSENENPRIENSISIENGAILYQIVAMNTYDLPCYGKDKHGKYIQSIGSAGAGVGCFISLYNNGIKRYYDGMRLFENISTNDTNHDAMVEYRNYICHFKYYAHLNESIMDLYSVAFDMFFAYSKKLHKNVPRVLENILKRYSVLVDMGIRTRKKSEVQDKKAGIISEKEHAILYIKEHKGLSSDKHVYSIGETNRKVDEVMEVRDAVFLDDIRKILEYFKK